MNPFELGDRVTRKDSTYHDGTVVEIVNLNQVRVYWRTPHTIEALRTRLVDIEALARKV